MRERKYDGFARKIQKAWRRYKSDQYFFKLKQKGRHQRLEEEARLMHMYSRTSLIRTPEIKTLFVVPNAIFVP